MFYGKDFISISKKESINWNDIKPLIFDLIQNHYEADEPLIVDKRYKWSNIVVKTRQA